MPNCRWHSAKPAGREERKGRRDREIVRREGDAVVADLSAVLPQHSHGGTMESHENHNQGSRPWEKNPGLASARQEC